MLVVKLGLRALCKGFFKYEADEKLFTICKPDYILVSCKNCIYL